VPNAIGCAKESTDVDYSSGVCKEVKVCSRESRTVYRDLWKEVSIESLVVKESISCVVELYYAIALLYQ